MVPAERFELPTFGLQNRCTTTVLRRRLDQRVIINITNKQAVRIGKLLNHPLSFHGIRNRI